MEKHLEVMEKLFAFQRRQLEFMEEQTRKQREALFLWLDRLKTVSIVAPPVAPEGEDTTFIL